MHLRRPMSTARAESIHAILSFQPKTVAQIRGLEQLLRGARGPVPPFASVPLHETRGWYDSNHVSVDSYFEWKPEVNSPRVCIIFISRSFLSHQSLSSPYLVS
jgi:hypothetical protein